MWLRTESEEKLRDAPRFCEKCGHELSHKKEAAGFDKDTGKALYETVVVCPNDKWFSIGHTIERYSPNGFGYTYDDIGSLTR